MKQGFLIAVFAVVMATFSTGNDSQAFQVQKKRVSFFFNHHRQINLSFFRRKITYIYIYIVWCFQFCQNKVKLEDDLPYMYGFFHLVFSLGAMYFAMLLISWDPDNLAKK